jgi:ribosomal subunit interface protein
MPNNPGKSQAVNVPIWAHRHDEIVPEAGQVPYRLSQLFGDSTVCTNCGATYHEGRWRWTPEPGAKNRVVCPACLRIRDGFCAGELSISGAFVQAHRADIDDVIQVEAKLETDEHPLHRIANIHDEADSLRISTTDVHLARRLGEALHSAFGGDLKVNYPPDAETVAVSWVRTDAHEPAVPVARPQIPIEVIGRGMEVPVDIEGMVMERIGRLHRFNERILSCRVTVEGQSAHHRQGGPYAVSVQLEVPGPDIVVNRQQAADLRVAIRFAFDAAQRKLEDQVRRQRPEAEPVDDRTFGHIARLFPHEEYGFLVNEDGQEVYFHRNSVLGARFESLSVGERVRYVEEQGEKGLQASSVLVRGMNP